MAPEINEKAKETIARVDALLDRLVIDLADETKPAADRMALAAELAPQLQSLLGEVVAEGVGQDHPALAAVGAKVHEIGARLNELGAMDDAAPPA